MEYKIAVPVVDGYLSSHFGHCQYFFIANVVDGVINQTSEEIPPPHAPGVIPQWLQKHQVDVVLVGGVGQKALNLFRQYEIKPVIGVPSNKTPQELVEDYLKDELISGVNQCSH